MSDPHRKLESENAPRGTISTPAATDASTAAPGAEANEILADSADYPEYLLNVFNASDVLSSQIDGPHTSGLIDLGGATTHARLRVTHLDTSTGGPNLKVIVERA